MIPKDSQDDTLKRFLNDCLVKPSAYIWPLIDLEKTDITSQLDEFDKDASLSDNDIDAVTDVDAMTEAWNHPTTGAAAWFTQLNADTLGVNQRLQQTYYDYIDATLRPKIVTTDNAAVNTAITNLGTVGPAMKADFNEIKSSSKSTINGLVDDAWELGVCSKIYNPYNALRKPMCDGVAGSLLSTWACLFMLAWFQLFTLFLINKTYKIMYRDSVPFQGTQDFAGIATAQETPSAPEPMEFVQDGKKAQGADFVYDAPAPPVPAYQPNQTTDYPGYADPDSYQAHQAGFPQQQQQQHQQQQYIYPNVDYGYA